MTESLEPIDVLMTREAFEHCKIRNALSVVSDGEQALQFLRREPPDEDAPPVHVPSRAGVTTAGAQRKLVATGLNLSRGRHVLPQW